MNRYVADFREFLKEGTFPEHKALIRNFVEGIEVVGEEAVLTYTIPMPDDSRIPGKDAAEMALNGSVLSTVKSGGPDWTKSRTEADSVVTPSLGMGMV